MNNKDMILNVMRAQGTADALDLRKRAANMTGTEIIAEREKAPDWDQTKDYTDWPAGSPIKHEGHTYGLIIPHNAAHQPPEARPSGLRALWSPHHTMDPKRAEPYIGPNGTSGLWSIGECCTENDHVWKNLYADNDFPPSALPERWEDLGTIEDVQGTV